nr:MAG TPA: hypothetical protein [Caudoviricetes sp.]DAQ13235.1 MAG TPA: hypothetical protein [Caudoviricetes sp.]
MYIIYNEEGPNSNELGPFRTTCIAHSIYKCYLSA